VGILNKLLPWYKAEVDEVKDARAEVAVERGKRAESNVRKLAETYQAVGITVKVVRTSIK